ncbi:cadherin repeat domain-containing protein [Dongia deserti]|uniref:cadherin repeat domain-containing protein n=1 Tax=Dongia deserti TaxID=2268030 RepID=UPI0013C40015|nr:cadherin repeat domain-containing protein [Dongia deserti]
MMAYRTLLAGMLVLLGSPWCAGDPGAESDGAGRLPEPVTWLAQLEFGASSLEVGNIGYLQARDTDAFTHGYSYALEGQPNELVVDRDTGALSLKTRIKASRYQFKAVVTSRSDPSRTTHFPLRLDVREGVILDRTAGQILHKIYDVDSGRYGRPDGLDYTNVLLNIRRAVMADQRAAGDGNLRATIYFRRGKTYDYTVNDWLSGLQYISVEPDPRYDPIGPRPRLRNTRQEFRFDSEIAILGSGGATAFDLLADKLKAYSPAIYSAKPGQDRVRLKKSADATFVKPGRWHLIGSYDQQLGGYPPNMRYFDYVKVVAVAGDEVILDRRLQNHHRDDYFEEPENANSLGIGRIIPLDLGGEGGLLPTSDSRLTIRLTVKDIEFLKNPSTDDGSNVVLYIAGAIDAIFENCVMPRPVPTIVQNMHFIGGTIESSEPDKLITSLFLENVRSGEIGGATGVDFMLIRNSSVAPFQVSPRHLRVVDSTIDGTTDTNLWYPVTFAYNGPVLSAEFESVMFRINPSNSDTRVMPAIQRPSLTIGSDATWRMGALIIPRSSPAFEDWQAWVFAGMIVYSEEHPDSWGVVGELSSRPDGSAISARVDWKNGPRPSRGKLVAGRGHKLAIDDSSKLTGKASWDALSGGFMWQYLPSSFGAVPPAVPTNSWPGAEPR